MAALARRLRWLVVWSARGPLDALYRRFYAAAIAFAARILGSFDSVAAIYLIRGAAKDGITPGISDIDLVVVTEDDSETAEIARRFRALDRITRRTIDYNRSFLHSRATLRDRWRNVPVWQAMYLAGQTSWKLLHGHDVLADLPPLTEMQRRTACDAEMNHWWMLFARQVLRSTAAQSDPVMAGSMAYKAASEVANAYHALATGEYAGTRADGINRLDADLAARLRAASARRFLSLDDGFLDQVFGFLLEAFLRHWAAFRVRPFLAVDPAPTLRVDCPRSEIEIGAREAALLQGLTDHLATRWGQKCRGTQVVKSAFWDFDDLLLIIDAEPYGRLRPTVREIAALGDRHPCGRPGSDQRVHVFLRFESVAFPITPVLPRDYHRGVLTPATVPDVFLQLGTSDACWTDRARWYLGDPATDLLRWPASCARKRAQLAVIARSAALGEIVFPLTAPALARVPHGRTGAVR